MLQDLKKSYNYLGEPLSKETWLLPKDENFFDESGRPKWEEFIQYGDEHGFDIRFSSGNGKHIKKIVLPIGKRIVRYGLSGGSFSTDHGAEYELLSLPYRKETVPYHEYLVTGRCEVQCVADMGLVAPGFGSIGGAIQYRHYFTIHDSLLEGILEEDLTWLQT